MGVKAIRPHSGQDSTVDHFHSYEYNFVNLISRNTLNLLVYIQHCKVNSRLSLLHSTETASNINSSRSSPTNTYKTRIENISMHNYKRDNLIKQYTFSR